VRQLLDVMGSGAMQLAFLSRQLLGFGRGGAELERRPAQLADLVDRSIALAQPALDRVDVRISLDDRELMCAVPLVIQALTNLIENAGAAAGAGGWIEIAARPDGEHVVIELTDSGGGVPAELRERVFEPFFTTKPPGAGVGLGLSLARSIVHRHGGTLDIRDRVGRAAFVVQLPCNSVPGPRSDAL
jgi:two-component system NtrC family sensor kinase